MVLSSLLQNRVPVYMCIVVHSGGQRHPYGSKLAKTPLHELERKGCRFLKPLVTDTAVSGWSLVTSNTTKHCAGPLSVTSLTDFRFSKDCLFSRATYGRFWKQDKSHSSHAVLVCHSRTVLCRREVQLCPGGVWTWTSSVSASHAGMLSEVFCINICQT